MATEIPIRTRHSQPGYLRSSYPIQNFEERADPDSTRRSALPACPPRDPSSIVSPSVEGAYGDMAELLQGETVANCYFADNDLIAAGALRALKEKGYQIPKDVAIIGFDNMPLCSYMEPALSTVQVPKQYMGQMAAKRLSRSSRILPPPP